MILNWQIAPGTPDISDGPVQGQEQWRHCRIAVVSDDPLEAREFVERIYEGMTVGRHVIIRRPPEFTSEVDHETKRALYKGTDAVHNRDRAPDEDQGNGA